MIIMTKQNIWHREDTEIIIMTKQIYTYLSLIKKFRKLRTKLLNLQEQ